MKLLRLARILTVGLRFGLEEFFLGHKRVRPLRWLVRTMRCKRKPPPCGLITACLSMRT